MVVCKVIQSSYLVYLSVNYGPLTSLHNPSSLVGQ